LAPKLNLNPDFSMPALPPSKLPHTGTSIFTVMSALADEHQAINLSQGFPDFDCSPRLLACLERALAGPYHQYAPMAGLPALQQEIARLTEHLHGASYDPETEITITSGATEGLYDAITAFVHPGDEVILFEPAYDAYRPNVELNGGKAIALPLTFPDFNIDWASFEAVLSPRTRMVVINSPHNPSGKVLSEADMQQLEKLLDGTDVLLVSDEVYEHIIFDGQAHQSACRFPGLKARCLLMGSFGKTLHITGWKIGYCLAPAALTAELRKVHQWVTFSISTPFQQALADFLAGGWEEILSLKAFYQAKRDLFRELMAPTPFEPLACAGTYFQLMRYTRISDQPDEAFARWLTTQIGVACIPVSAFYADQRQQGVVRFCFPKDDQTLVAGADRLKARL
jgi:methionine transaminase